jgi:PAS domain S-box-containing protein
VKPDFKAIVRIGNLSGAGVFVFDVLERHFVYVNHSLAQLFGFTKVTGLRLSDFNSNIIPDDFANLKSRYLELQSDDVVENVVFHIQARGEVMPVTLSAFRIGDLIIGFLRDIRELQSFLTPANKNVTAQMISHSLAGPMSIARNILNSLNQIIKHDDEDVDKHLELIRESINHCNDVINESSL